MKELTLNDNLNSAIIIITGSWVYFEHSLFIEHSAASVHCVTDFSLLSCGVEEMYVSTLDKEVNLEKLWK